MKKTIFLILLILPIVLISQTVKLDSLNNILGKTKLEIKKAKILIELSHEYGSVDIDEAIKTANVALGILKTCKEDTVCWELLANAYNSLGIAYNNKAEFQNAIINFNKAIEFDKKRNNQRSLAERLLNLGIIYKSLGDYTMALELYDSTLKVSIKMGYKNLYAMTKVNQGVLNYEIGDFDKALKDYYEALEFKKEEKDQETAAILLYNIGLILDEKRDFKNANDHYKEALELFKQQSNLYGQAYCLSCIGGNYLKEENYLEAIDCYNKAYSIHEKLDNKQGIGETYGEMGVVYHNNKKYNKAKEFYNLAFKTFVDIEYPRGQITSLQNLGELDLEIGAYENALKMFIKSQILADSINDRPQLKDANDYLSQTYAQLGNYKKAYIHYRKYSDLKDSIFNIEVEDNITKMKAQHDISARENEIKILKNEKVVKDLKIKKQRIFLVSFIGGLIFITVFLWIAIVQKNKIRAANVILAYQKKQITDSIEYASRIQTAILPPGDYISRIIPEHFIVYKPRDIVSGDFYWITHKEGKIVVAVVDCTGHGVPGAFMSMLGFAFLNEIVNREKNLKANEILNQLRDNVKESLHQTGKEDEAKDGMDIALCIIDPEKLSMQFAGAYNPLYLLRNNDLITLKADRMPIGIHVFEKDSFTNHEMKIQKGDTIYVFTDGYIDQFGGKKMQKFKIAPFKDLLISLQHKSMDQQKHILEETLDAWMGDHEQIDDILVMGIKI